MSREQVCYDGSHMLTAQQILKSLAMLNWDHARVIHEIQQESLLPNGITLLGALPPAQPFDLDCVSLGTSWTIQPMPTPSVSAPNDNADAIHFVRSLARRESTLVELMQFVLSAPVRPVRAEDLADALGQNPWLVEKLRGCHRVRIDGAVISLTELILPIEPTSRRWIHFESMLMPCMNHFDIGDPTVYEWPNNVLSTKTVVYEGGRIAREGTVVDLRYDESELQLCEQLSDEAATIMTDAHVSTNTEATGEDAQFRPFFVLATPGQPKAATIDEHFIRALFGETICPLDPIVVEPFAVGSQVFNEVRPEDLPQWQKLQTFFASHESLSSPTWAAIGFFDYAPARSLAAQDRPVGFEMRGSCLPRLLFAFTPTGSVVGLFGSVVWT